MPSISKELFYEKITSDMSCGLLHYWDNDCKTAFLQILPDVAKGAAKFFLPVFLLRLVIDYKRKKKNLLKTLIEREIRAILYGLCMGGSIIAGICVLHKICGRVNYYNLLLIPGMLSGTSILVESDENQTLNTLIFFNSFIETILNKLKLSGQQQTVLFMVMSGILMQLFESRKEKIDFIYWWFYTPPMETRKPDQIKCSHNEICTRFILHGFINYFLVGTGINITKRLLGKITLIPKHPMKILGVFFHKSNAYFGLFVGTYVGLYRALTCSLKIANITSKWDGLISGILSGITYSLYPTIQVPVLAITTILQILYHNLCKKYKITNHFYQRLLLFQIVHGYNLHNKFFFNSTCSPYYDKMIDGCTNNMTKDLFQHLITKYFS